MALDLKRVQALCFDIDGTLSDTDDHYVRRMAHFLKPVQILLPGQDSERFARRLVMALETPLNACHALADRLYLDKVWAFIARPWRKHASSSDLILIPGVQTLLQNLAAIYPLAVVSARGQHSTLAFLQQHHLRDFFKVIVTSQTCSRTKPHPAPIHHAAKHLGIAPQACVMIGDTAVDIKAGRAAGAQTIGVLCGFGKRAELIRAGADHIVASTADLGELFKHPPPDALL